MNDDKDIAMEYSSDIVYSYIADIFVKTITFCKL